MAQVPARTHQGLAPTSSQRGNPLKECQRVSERKPITVECCDSSQESSLGKSIFYRPAFPRAIVKLRQRPKTQISANISGRKAKMRSKSQLRHSRYGSSSPSMSVAPRSPRPYPPRAGSHRSPTSTIPARDRFEKHSTYVKVRNQTQIIIVPA